MAAEKRVVRDRRNGFIGSWLVKTLWQSDMQSMSPSSRTRTPPSLALPARQKAGSVERDEPVGMRLAIQAQWRGVALGCFMSRRPARLRPGSGSGAAAPGFAGTINVQEGGARRGSRACGTELPRSPPWCLP
ncbi:hypothetical protein AXF42_Ash013640 [Apostasia shenzhenica]|uniref:Uncharacterized protein n=1 Tax=Apostasia shenzhenica TaxID=1088818 RepID=A0A2I0API0_9ASPA|nr:hypothetical protein AXF42_Ash013640 [Apostasia shenzhenica]